MNSQVRALPLQVPPVTENDLRRFRAEHFPHAPLPSNFFCASEHLYEDYQDYEDEDEDDCLGYYPDATKRTLTDEQIALFRHSEIQQLLREKRYREEEAAAREEESTEGVVDGPQEAGEVPDSEEHTGTKSSSGVSITADVKRNKSAEFMPYGGGSKKRLLPKYSDVQADGGDKKKTRRNKRFGNGHRNDPKLNWRHWDDPERNIPNSLADAKAADAAAHDDNGDREGDEMTPRRIARELDEPAEDFAGLDYD